MKNLFSFVCLSIALTAVSNAQIARNALRVEVMIFSGRPNPVFTITDPAEIREILTLAGNLPRQPALNAGAGQSEQAPTLGYRGLQIINSSNISPEFQSMTVRRSSVQLARKNLAQRQTTTGANTTASESVVSEARIDRGISLENRLLEIARRRNLVDVAVLDEVRLEQ